MKKIIKHVSPKISYLDKSAEFYDVLNEKKSLATNQVIEKILKKHKVKTVLDVTCGTGSQVFFLAKHGYQVTGSDISPKMLAVAKNKAKKEKLKIKFIESDMRTVKVGKFDAVLSIFNAVGYLTKAGFEKAMRSVHANLNDGGLFVFDNFNLNYLLKNNNIANLTIDWIEKLDKKQIRYIQYSTITQDGVLASYTTSYEQKGDTNSRMSQDVQTLQVYSAQQLKTMLQKTGFKVIETCAVDGSKFSDTKSERILVVAQKI